MLRFSFTATRDALFLSFPRSLEQMPRQLLPVIPLVERINQDLR
jgi:hypothetical protein